MPELPDIVIYLEALEQRVLNQTLERVAIASPFLLRTAVPSITSIEGKKVIELRRLGKRICLRFENDVWLVLHLMIAGRLHWKHDPVANRAIARPSGRAPAKGRNNLASFHFSNGTMTLTEAGTQRRASLHLVAGEAGLQSLNPGGLEIFETNLGTFAGVLRSANHTLKRALTDPRLFSGIGNAYSDEILWAAQLSPVKLTQKLTDEEIECLFEATRSTLAEWVERGRGIAVITGSDSDRVLPEQTTPIPFPEKVTVFRPDMAVHGRYGQPCPRCGNKVQRIRYASNETNYCPTCQTGGKLLADRALSRLLRADWPKSLEELEGLTSR